MRESWVSPVTEGREPPPAWIAVWRFRLVLLVILAIGVAAVIVAYHYASGAADQGPHLTRAAGPAERLVTVR